jgi:DNA-binding NarL/FixJ family response regulator
MNPVTGPTQGQPRVRVIVAEDDPLARRLIKEHLQSAGMVVLAEAANGREAVELTLHYRPDVLLMDVVMPELDGVSALRRILDDAPEQVVVLLTNADDEEMGLLAIRTGAAGVLKKSMDVAALPTVVTVAHLGEAVISRRLATRLAEELRRTSEPGRGLRPVKGPLSSREWEVVDLMQAGKTVDEIADALVLARETVRSHVKNILRKLGVRSRNDAIAAAERLRQSR